MKNYVKDVKQDLAYSDRNGRGLMHLCLSDTLFMRFHVCLTTYNFNMTTEKSFLETFLVPYHDSKTLNGIWILIKYQILY